VSKKTAVTGGCGLIMERLIQPPHVDKYIQCYWKAGDMTISGQTASHQGTDVNVAFVRLDSAGTGQWITGLSSTIDVEGYGMAIDPVSKDVFASGYYEGDGAQLGSGATAITTAVASGVVGFFLRLSPNGVPVFLKTLTVGENPADPTDDRSLYLLGLASDDLATSFWVTGYASPGDVVFAGETLAPYNTDYSSLLLLNYDADGTEIWGNNFISEGPLYPGGRWVS